jgi:glucose-6-phosphate 1-epimerase
MQAFVLTTANGASAEIYPYGAHLTSWKTARGNERLYLSPKVSPRAVFAEGKAIRGGVPVIFPQFNERGTGPRHGFARTANWHLLDPPHASATTSQCVFRLGSTPATEKVWPHRFALHYQIKLSDDALELALTVHNTDAKPFAFTAALHTYLAVSALRNVTLAGLDGKTFWDNDGSPFDHRKIQLGNTLTLTDALDRVYFGVTEPLQLTDNREALWLSQSGFNDVVVWNPGKEAAKGMADMPDGDYQVMLCVEAARIDSPVTLHPDEQWTGVQRLQS